MRIIEWPSSVASTTVKCEFCGCVYEFDHTDLEIRALGSIEVDCPFCGRAYDVDTSMKYKDLRIDTIL